jgi:tRNA (adenine22-N1)-methyltransferase
MKFSNRLQYVFDHLLIDQDVWDFCCDHGYLGAKAYQSGLFKNIYFVDRVSSIMERVQLHFNSHLLQKESKSQVYFFLTDGQNVLKNVSGTVSITGVGAHVIFDILKGLAQRNVLNATRLILGPHRHTEKLLKMISDEDSLKNYRLVATDEVIEKERRRIFYIFEN